MCSSIIRENLCAKKIYQEVGERLNLFVPATRCKILRLFIYN